MKNVKIKILTLVFSFVILTMIAGCQRTQKPIQNPPMNPNLSDRMRTPDVPGTDLSRLGTPGDNPMDINMRDNIRTNPGLEFDRNMLGMDDTNNRMNMNNRNNNTGLLNNNRMGTDSNVTAQNIANQLAAMDSIENATVVISGNTALVGIDIKDNYYKHSEEGYLKNDLVSKIKSMAPGVTRVAISESPDMYDRIKNLSRDMRNGNTVKGITDEFTEIVNKIKPVVK